MAKSVEPGDSLDNGRIDDSVKRLYLFARYQINAKTELAQRYNNKSPLENHHCAVAFQILGDPDTNIFANTDRATYSSIRSVCIDRDVSR